MARDGQQESREQGLNAEAPDGVHAAPAQSEPPEQAQAVPSAADGRAPGAQQEKPKPSRPADAQPKRRRKRKSLVRFLPGVDLRGRRDSEPGWGWLVWGMIVLVGALVAGLVMGGTRGTVLWVIALILIVVWIVVGLYVTYALFSHYDGSLLTRREHEALAGRGDERLLERAAHVMQVGPFLARATRELPMGDRSELRPDELNTIEENRKAEARLTAAWTQSVGELQVVSIMADDGVLLTAHVLECAPQTKRWVVLAHDYHGHWNEMLLYTRSYAQRGFNLLIPEMRAHGLSEGSLIGMGWLDRLDLISWCRWIVSNKEEQARIVLHGHSMGGVAACLAACDKLLPSGVMAAVVDSPYSDAWNMLTRVLRGCHLPVRPMAQMVRLLLKMAPGGYDLANASAVHAVEHAQVPTLIIHGEKDTMVPPYMAKKTYDHVGGSATGDNSRLRMFPHAGHCQAVLSDPKTYYHEVFSFLKPRL